MKWTGHAACTPYDKCIQDFLGNTEGKKSIERNKHTWEVSAKMGLRRIEWDFMEIILLTQDKEQ
jgi:hypothetical protein